MCSKNLEFETRFQRKVPLFWRYPNFLIIQCRVGHRSQASLPKTSSIRPDVLTENQIVTDTVRETAIATHTHAHPFNGSLSGTTQVSRYQKGKTNLDFIEARDSEWQGHQLGHMQVCTSLQTDNHASTPPLSFLQAGFPS